MEDVVKRWFNRPMLLIMLMLPLHAFAGVPLDTVKSNVNDVLNVLRDPQLQRRIGP